MDFSLSADIVELRERTERFVRDEMIPRENDKRLGHHGPSEDFRRELVELVRAAADLDATMDKHPATPAEVLPARELLADLLLAINDSAAALKEYELSLKSEPNRFRSILGKARAAQQSGDMATARDAYQKLLALSSQADADRPERSEAKAFLSKNI